MTIIIGNVGFIEEGFLAVEQVLEMLFQKGDLPFQMPYDAVIIHAADKEHLEGEDILLLRCFLIGDAEPFFQEGLSLSGHAIMPFLVISFHRMQIQQALLDHAFEFGIDLAVSYLPELPNFAANIVCNLLA